MSNAGLIWSNWFNPLRNMHLLYHYIQFGLNIFTAFFYWVTWKWVLSWQFDNKRPSCYLSCSFALTKMARNWLVIETQKECWDAFIPCPSPSWAPMLLHQPSGPALKQRAARGTGPYGTQPRYPRGHEHTTGAASMRWEWGWKGPLYLPAHRRVCHSGSSLGFRLDASYTVSL